MKRILLAIFASIFCVSAYSHEIELSEPEIWAEIYHGNFSLAHKMVLARPCVSSNDQLLSQFMMTYLCYKNGKIDEMERILDGVDHFIENQIIR